jgi:hypothetical protein
VTPSDSTVRRWLWPTSLAGRAVVVGIAAALSLVGLWFVAVLVAERRVAASWKASEAMGLSSRLEDLLPPAMSPEQNAAYPLERASDRSADLLLAWEWRAGIVVADLSHREHGALLDGLLDDPVYERHLAAADETPDYAPLDDPRLGDVWERPRLVGVRGFGHGESMLAKHLVESGRYEEAIRRLVRYLRLFRKWGEKETTLTGFSAGYVFRQEALSRLNEAIRRRGRLSWALADEIENELRLNEGRPQDLPMMAQRQKFIELHAYDDYNPLCRHVLLRPAFLVDHAAMLDEFNAVIRCTAEPYAAVKSEFDRMERDEERLRQAPLAGLQRGTIETLMKIRHSRPMMDSMTAWVRCLRVVTAMARQRDFNADLDSLGLPKRCLTDPFDGKRLRVRRTPDGPIVYSVGPDLVDDGGEFGSRQDRGFGPPKKRDDGK